MAPILVIDRFTRWHSADLPAAKFGRLAISTLVFVVLSGGFLAIISMFDSERIQDISFKAVLGVGIFGVPIIFVSRGFFGSDRVDRLLLNLAIGVVSLTSVLLIAEHSIRYVLPRADGRGVTIPYYQNRWRRDVRANSLGFREREFDLKNAEGSFRVAVIGDSITYGQGVREDERFTNILQAEFSEMPGRYEILNFGRPGAETIHHLQILKSEVLQVNPDFILLQWFVNDVEGKDKSGRPDPISIVPVAFRENSAFLSQLHDFAVGIQERMGLAESYDEYMINRFGKPTSRSSKDALLMLKEFVEMAQENDIPVGMILFDLIYSHDSQMGFLLDRTMAFCEEQAIRCLDLRDTFAPFRGNRLLWANWGDRHPSSYAHGLVAKSILNEFQEEWELPG